VEKQQVPPSARFGWDDKVEEWLPFEIGSAGPRSQERDLGHPSICCREGGLGSFLYQLVSASQLLPAYCFMV
jgi:hypothetical protein